MKVILLVVAALTLSAALNDNALKQGQIFDQDFVKEAKQTSIGRALLSFMELSELAQQFDYSRLFQAIDELSESLQSAKEEENRLFDDDFQQYVVDVQFYTNQVTQFTSEVAQHNQDLTTLNERLTHLEGYLQEKIDQLAQTRQLKETIITTMERNARVFATQMQDFTNAINLLDQVIALLEQLHEDPSFLETNHEQFAKLGQNLHESFGNFHNTRVFYQPLAEALIQMSTEKFADQQLVKRVLNMLNALRQSLVQSRQTLQNNYELEKQSNEQLLGEYNQLIDSLEAVVIPQLHEDITTTHADIDTKNGLLRDAQENLAAAQDNLQHTEDRWLARQNSHKALLEEYNRELAVIAKAVEVLNRGGVRRQ